MYEPVIDRTASPLAMPSGADVDASTDGGQQVVNAESASHGSEWLATSLLSLPLGLAALLIGAHFLRQGDIGLVAACLASPAVLVLRRRWVPAVLTVLALAAAVVWVDTAADLALIRGAHGMPWRRAAAIIGGVALVTALAPLVFRTEVMRRRFALGSGAPWIGAGAFLGTAVLTGVVQVVVASPMLLAERLAPGAGWIEVLALSVYAALVAELLLDPARQPIWRLRIWTFFSVVFFGQLALGIAGVDELLMTGRLHVPVPAVIVAGPVFRGEGFFMAALFAVTLVLVGPAWCSHLCYFGAWDGLLARPWRRSRSLPRWSAWVRVASLAGVVVVAWLLRALGASGAVAAGLALAFGAVGVATMVFVTRRWGTMFHCAVFCPLGLLADVLGKVSPFRLRIGDGCTECLSCARACRYGALPLEAVRRRRPALTCSLCGDCVGACKDGQIDYRLLGLHRPWVRSLFVVTVVTLHAVFLGVARG
jgi:ferredoxin